MFSLMAVAGLCEKETSVQELFHIFTQEVLESLYYQRKQGKDHLLVMGDWRASVLVLKKSPVAMKNQYLSQPNVNTSERYGDTFQTVRHVMARNFLIGIKTRQGAISHGQTMNLGMDGIRDIVVP